MLAFDPRRCEAAMTATVQGILSNRLMKKVMRRATEGRGFSPAAKRAQHFQQFILGHGTVGLKPRPSEALSNVFISLVNLTGIGAA